MNDNPVSSIENMTLSAIFQPKFRNFCALYLNGPDFQQFIHTLTIEYFDEVLGGSSNYNIPKLVADSLDEFREALFFLYEMGCCGMSSANPKSDDKLVWQALANYMFFRYYKIFDVVYDDMMKASKIQMPPCGLNMYNTTMDEMNTKYGRKLIHYLESKVPNTRHDSDSDNESD